MQRNCDSNGLNKASAGASGEDRWRRGRAGAGRASGARATECMDLEGPLWRQSYTRALSIPAQGLTLHLSSCDNITGRDAGHVDQVDRTVSLHMETRWKDSINPTNLTSTSITPASPRPNQTLGLAPPPASLSPTLGCWSDAGNAGLAARMQAVEEMHEAERGRQHPEQEPNRGTWGKMSRAEPHIFYQPTKGYLSLKTRVCRNNLVHSVLGPCESGMMLALRTEQHSTVRAGF